MMKSGVLEWIFLSFCFLTLYYSADIVGHGHDQVTLTNFVGYSLRVSFVWFISKFFPFFAILGHPLSLLAIIPGISFFPPYGDLILNLAISTCMWWISGVLLLVLRLRPTFCKTELGEEGSSKKKHRHIK